MAEPLEERLPGALRRQAGDDEGVASLAAGARARAARRGRRRTAGTVVAAAVAVAAVPTAIALTGSSPSVDPAPSPPTTSDVAPTPTPDPAPSGTRVESWRNLTVSVPAEWGYGGGSDWCAADGSGNVPEVARPEGAVQDILCTPELSYGLQFVDGSAIRWARDSGDVWQYRWDSPDQVKVYPEDAWLGHVRVGDHALMVVTADEETARAVVESAREVSGTDPNGCAPRDGEDAATGDGERWSVCRYSAEGWLVQSELLTAEQSGQFLAAVQAAPPFAVVGECRTQSEPVGRVAAGTDGDLGTVSIVYEDTCFERRGVFFSGSSAALTEDVLYWALSPGWSGGVDGSVPLPGELRR